MSRTGSSLRQVAQTRMATRQPLKVGKGNGGVNALKYYAEHPTLLQVSRSRAVAVWHGLIFDFNEREPLQLTPANLERCIGAPAYNEAQLSRGYAFIQQRARKADVACKRRVPLVEPDLKRGRGT